MSDSESMITRSIIDASQEPADLRMLTSGDSVYLLPCIDRPFLQHVIEYMVRQKVTQIELLVGEQGGELKKVIGDGTRWGVKIHYHLLSENHFALSRLKALDLDPQEKILLARGDCMPVLNVPDGIGHLPIFPGCAADAGDWNGWALIAGEKIVDLANCEDLVAAEAKVKSWRCETHDQVWTTDMLKFNSLKSYLETTFKVLKSEAGEVMINGRTGEPGVWINRNVVIHPTATIIPPVYIGENSRIGKNVTLGPLAVLSENSLLDQTSIIKQSVVFPYSYVGEFLEVEDSVVDKNRMVNTRQTASLEVEDDFILGSMLERSGNARRNQLLQSFLGILLLPIYLLQKGSHFMKAKCGRPVALSRIEVLKPPLGVNPDRWKATGLFYYPVDEEKTARSYFSHVVLPNIGNVIRGRILLVGAPMRTREEVLEMDEPRRKLFSASRPGLIDEVRVLYGDACVEDHVYATEVVYSVSRNFRYDLRLFFRFISIALKIRKN